MGVGVVFFGGEGEEIKRLFPCAQRKNYVYYVSNYAKLRA